jgi:RHS repeat-associated protein
MQFDNMGRVGSMLDASNNSTVASASYGVAGQITSLSYFGFSESRSFNNLLQMTQQTVSNGGTQVMNMQYNYTAGANNGRIASSVDGIIGETVNYGYDSLNRLSSALATNNAWGQGFGYDGFGNLTSKTALAGSVPTLSLSFDPLTNHQNGMTYDANGNPAGPTYDVENRMIVQGVSNGDTYNYDHAGNRVMKVWGPGNGTFEIYFYGIGGQKLMTKQCTLDGNGNPVCSAAAFNTYFGGKLVKSKSVVVATDRLGSVRANSNGEQFRYYPYGEERTSTADNRDKFGTYMRDNPGQDYADQRYYAVGMGRFNVPDPLGIVKLRKPESWNQYAYSYGDPINFHDPRGAAQVWVCFGPEDDRTCAWEDDGTDELIVYPPPPSPGGVAPTNVVQAQTGAPSKPVKVYVSNYSTTSQKAIEVQNDLRFIAAGLASGVDPDCNSWLKGNADIISYEVGDKGVAASVGVGTMSPSSTNAVAGVEGTNLAAGATITINLDGAFWNSNAATGVVGIDAGTIKAQVFILLHELAHNTAAQDFWDNDDTTARQDHNNLLVMSHCSRAIKFFSEK